MTGAEALLDARRHAQPVRSETGNMSCNVGRRPVEVDPITGHRLEFGRRAVARGCRAGPRNGPFRIRLNSMARKKRDFYTDPIMGRRVGHRASRGIPLQS